MGQDEFTLDLHPVQHSRQQHIGWVESSRPTECICPRQRIGRGPARQPGPYDALVHGLRPPHWEFCALSTRSAELDRSFSRAPGIRIRECTANLGGTIWPQFCRFQADPGDAAVV